MSLETDIIVVNNNTTLLGFFALLHNKYLSKDYIILYTERVNPSFLLGFNKILFPMYHNCNSFYDVICVRKFVKKIKKLIDSLQINSYRLIIPNSLNSAYQILQTDRRCVSYDYLEEGTLAYTQKAPFSWGKIPLSKLIYGAELNRYPRALLEGYGNLYALTKESFLFDSSKVKLLSIPDSIPNYDRKCKKGDTIVVLNGGNIDNYFETHQGFLLKSREAALNASGTVFIKPHPSHYLRRELLERIESYFQGNGEFVKNNDLIVEIEAMSTGCKIVCGQSSIADILPHYGCDVTIINA